MAGQRRGEVSLEEMTRRRDGWKRIAEEKTRQLADALAREAALTVDRDRAVQRAQESAQNLLIMRAVKDAAQAEARRYAEECGRLRDELLGVEAMQREINRLQDELEEQRGREAL